MSLPSPAWRARTERVRGRLELPGMQPAGERLFRDATSARHVWLLNPPAARGWAQHGVLMSERPAGFRLESGAVVVDGDAGEVEIDLVELDGPGATALAADRSAPLVVLGSFAPLAGPDTLGQFLVGNSVLDTTIFTGRRCPSEQTALYLWRVCRLRGGPFWGGAADHVAEIVRKRIETSTGRGPVHDLREQDDVHLRFLTGAALLLMAEAARRSGDDAVRWQRAADRALTFAEEFAMPYAGGRWYTHDTRELDAGHNLLVLNTHVHHMAALAAAGRDLGPATVALDHALALRGTRLRSLGLAVGIAAADAAAGWVAPAVPRARRRVAQLTGRVERAAARARAERPNLRFPGGYVTRDAAPTVSPAHYFATNVYDLGVLAANGLASTRVERVFRSALRYARVSGHARAQRLVGHAMAAVWPVALQQAGRTRAAERAAEGSLAAGMLPSPGWPGYHDQPWPMFRPGTT